MFSSSRPRLVRRLSSRVITLEGCRADSVSSAPACVVDRASLEPGGQLVLTLKAGEQGATKADVAELTSRLRRIESLLSAPR